MDETNQTPDTEPEATPEAPPTTEPAIPAEIELTTSWMGLLLAALPLNGTVKIVKAEDSDGAIGLHVRVTHEDGATEAAQGVLGPGEPNDFDDALETAVAELYRAVVPAEPPT